MVDRAFKVNVGRQGFGSVNPEIRIIEGRIVEVLLYIVPNALSHIESTAHIYRHFIKSHFSMYCLTSVSKFCILWKIIQKRDFKLFKISMFVGVFIAVFTANP